MSEADIWTPHLRADERVLWQAPVVEQLYRVEKSQQRALGLVIVAIALVVAVMFSLKVIDLIPRPDTYQGMPSPALIPPMPGLTAVFFGPIYVAVILACLAIAIGQIGRFKLPRPAAAQFAVTSARVLALNTAGAVIDRLEGSDIAAVRLLGVDAARGLSVRPKPGEFYRPPFVIVYVEGLAEAKTAIEEAFLQPRD